MTSSITTNLEKLTQLQKQLEDYVHTQTDRLLAAKITLKTETLDGGKENHAQMQQRVRFNVGGQPYSITYANIVKEKNLLSTVCKLNPDQPIFIDRDHNGFDAILKYFRGEVLTSSDLKNPNLLEETEFYEIEGLLKLLKPVTLIIKKSATPPDTDGGKLMHEFEEELATQSTNLECDARLLEQLSDKQEAKIKRYFGWGIVKLDVGGHIFETTSKTLEPIEQFMTLQSDGSFFIDRSPDYFPLVLRQLRNQKGVKRTSTLQRELDYYKLSHILGKVQSMIMLESRNVFYSMATHAHRFTKQEWNNILKSGSLDTTCVYHRLSLKISKMNRSDISPEMMIGFGPDRLLEHTKGSEIYDGPGKYLYCSGNRLYGTDGGDRSSDFQAISLKLGDTLHFELDTREKILSLAVNDGPTQVLLENVKLPQDCRFYIIGSQSDDEVQIL